jgi:hypothetical protein
MEAVEYVRSLPSPPLSPKKDMKPSKVYTGTIPIKEHIDNLVKLYNYPRKPVSKPVPEPKSCQSIEIRRLKRETGLE